MKRATCLFLTVLLLFAFSGCEQESEIQFFYPRTEVQYGIPNGVIASEFRSIDNDGMDLSYLLKLYLEGPISQTLRSPFPKRTALEALSFTDGHIVIVLSEHFAALENLDRLIACASIASTCFSLTDADTVTIHTLLQSMTLTRDNLMLEDMAAASTPK